MKVKIKGKSAKGKSRIKEHGEWWEVIKTDNPICCGGEVAHFVESVRTGHTRWVSTENDRDFEILATED